MRYEEVTLDREDMRVRKCWWISGCCSQEVIISNNFPLPKYNQEGTKELTEEEVKEEMDRRSKKPPTAATQRYTIEVTEEEARTGKGRRCPSCGKLMGCYVCDGFPTFQGSVVFAEGGK